jgi:hypothetical protein
LAKIKNNSNFDQTLLNILNTLLIKNPSFIIDYMDMLILSNLLIHVYDQNINKQEILKILNSFNENKKYLKIKQSSNAAEEINRLKLISKKIKDEQVKNILNKICLE